MSSLTFMWECLNFSFVFIFTFVFKGYFAGYRILVWESFSFQHFEYIFPFPSGFHGFWRASQICIFSVLNQIWENFGYYFIKYSFPFLSFMGLPSMHLFICLMMPHRSLGALILFIFSFCSLDWIILIDLASNLVILSSACLYQILLLMFFISLIIFPFPKFIFSPFL